MASRPSSRRRALAVPAGLALTASLALLPGTGTALAQEADLPAAASAATDGEKLSYVVNTSSTAPGTVKRVQKEIARAGGTVVVTHQRIGVIVAHSSDPSFAERMRRVRGVESAGATRTAPLKSAGTTEVGAPEYVTEKARVSATTAAAEGEPLEADLWGLRAIRADEAAKVNPGSEKVTVAVIDTGVDDTHPDIAPNFSASQSANRAGGVADTSEGAWRPYTEDDYHGTHVAGTIAAARNGIGVAGVAPGVKVSSINVTERDSGLFYAEAVVCAFVFAADKGVEITNNSYYVDPYMYNCEDDADQGAILEAVRRAARYAEKKGTLHLASAGNSNHDLASDAIVDDSSPNDTTPVERTIDPSECLDLPTQLPGVVTVTATGVQNVKSYYSSYGYKVADIAAPGGDRYQIPDTPAKNGRILSTMPNGSYAYLQGTSMASPHASGVAALLKSRHPWASPAMLQLMMKGQADNPGCPEFYDPDGNGVEDSTCEGGKNVNGFYGHGIVDALDAVK
ncbi:S8 family serine peptidase [Streptomyces glaucosporus]|uniref:S8 family serine peptidase n=1 Tax=Streptomyces glaucosporus TaxID=284044 RepID=A0ABP5VT71_9ACTN